MLMLTAKFALIAYLMSPTHVQTAETLSTHDLPVECNSALAEALNDGYNARCEAIDADGNVLRRIVTPDEEVRIITPTPFRLDPNHFVIEVR